MSKILAASRFNSFIVKSEKHDSKNSPKFMRGRIFRDIDTRAKSLFKKKLDYDKSRVEETKEFLKEGYEKDMSDLKTLLEDLRDELETLTNEFCKSCEIDEDELGEDYFTKKD